MITIVKFKDFNPRRFDEEIDAAGFNFGSFFAGFEEVTRRLVTPASAPRLITRRNNKGEELFEDFAQPGEVRFKNADESNRTALDNLLDAHDATNQSKEQDEQDIDKTEIQELSDIHDAGVTGANRNRAIEIMVRLIVRDAL